MLKGYSVHLVNKISVLIIIVWSLMIIAVGLFQTYGNRNLAINSALIEAQILIEQEELNRFWIANNDGIYIHSSSTEGVKKNPKQGVYSDEQSADFTLISHIYMTRQMYEKLEDDFGFRARIVRPESMRPEGLPDPWEKNALRVLEQGRPTYHETVTVHGEDRLRFIHAMRVKQECLRCHKENYQVGDLLGGFSLSIPLSPYYSALGFYRYSVMLGYFLIWTIGVVLTRFAARLIASQLEKSYQQECQLQLAETNLHYLSFFDQKTNLPNRTTFDDRLRVALTHAVRLQHRVAIAVVNLEDFDKIKGAYNSETGDKLVKKVAEVITTQIRPDDTVARMGNEKLLLLLPGLVSRENVARIVNNINSVFDPVIDLEGTELFTKISFGVSVFPDDSTDPNLLVSYAEAAALRVTQNKVSNLQMYSEELNAAAQAHLQLETGLRQALSRNEFRVYFQPQIDAPSGRVIGAEALIRWQHPDLGLISPDSFIPLAENNGMIVSIGEWVLLETCRQVVQWKKRYQRPFCVGVNISSRQFQDIALVDVIDSILLETGMNPADLEIEVTEGTIMEDIDRAVETLVDLKVRGIDVSIDDFGTGYSSLSQLKMLPFDRLKIDRTFISDLDNNRDSQVIVEMIIELAAKLNMAIIAEGVETEDQKKFLISRGCYSMQGYLFGKPMTAYEFNRLLESSNL
jgi:diguanylate cyclase (GGDEF)-like protein